MSRHGALRASDADRDQIVERLHRAATEGRIAAEELEHRVSAALRARTYGELDATISDLPGPRTVARRRAGTGAADRRSPAGWALSVLRTHPALLLLAIPALALTMALAITATVIWAAVMIVVLLVGGRHGLPLPWAYGRAMRRCRGYGAHRGSVRAARSAALGRDPRRGRSSYGRGAGRHWA